MKIYKCFPQGKAKVLTMSYDDGKQADCRLIKIFNKYGIRSTFNVNSGLLGGTGCIDKQELAKLYEGQEVATHTVSHPTLERCPMTQIAKEILEDRIELEKLTGYPVRGHAYPNGSYSQRVKDILSELGIVYARTVKETHEFELPADYMEWNATCHHNHNLMEHSKEFVEFKKTQYLKCMYVWGHSYEFDKDNNWELIEEFCKYIGGKEDIWYATNIQIYDYMMVCDNLQFAASGEFVYNPSVASAWISIDDVVVEIKGGMLKYLK